MRRSSVLRVVNKATVAAAGSDAAQQQVAPGGLADLYARLAPGAVRLAFLMTGDRWVAEDIAQDAFVRVAGRLHHLRDPRAFEAYLRRAVVNLAKNHYRRRAVERAFLLRSHAPEAMAGPEGRLIERYTVIAALGKLTQRQRAAIVLRFYEDLPEDDVAQILRCRAGTVRSLVTRGVQTLRTHLEREPDA